MIWGQMNTIFRDDLSGNKFKIFNKIHILYQHKRAIKYLVKQDINAKLIRNRQLNQSGDEEIDL